MHQRCPLRHAPGTIARVRTVAGLSVEFWGYGDDPENGAKLLKRSEIAIAVRAVREEPLGVLDASAAASEAVGTSAHGGRRCGTG